MIYIFPETKFVKKNRIITQIKHISNEYYEFIKTSMESEEEKEEAMDLYHSLETLFRIWESKGIDMEAVQGKVFEKNRERGYYAK